MLDLQKLWQSEYGGFYTGLIPIEDAFRQSGMYPNTTLMARTVKRSGWHKCPFCNQRQDVNEDGPTCKRCNGDILGKE